MAMPRRDQTIHPGQDDFYLNLGMIVGLLSRDDIRASIQQQVRNGEEGLRTRAYLKYAIQVMRALLPTEDQE